MSLGSGYILIGIGIAGLGFQMPGTWLVWGVLLFGFVIGLGNGIISPVYTYILQKETSEHMIGRVFGIQSTLSSAIMIIAPLLGGWWIQSGDPGSVFAWTGAAIVVLGIVGVLASPMIVRSASSTD